jgi:hypothetical protein
MRMEPFVIEYGPLVALLKGFKLHPDLPHSSEPPGALHEPPPTNVWSAQLQPRAQAMAATLAIDRSSNIQSTCCRCASFQRAGICYNCQGIIMAVHILCRVHKIAADACAHSLKVSSNYSSASLRSTLSLNEDEGITGEPIAGELQYLPPHRTCH